MPVPDPLGDQVKALESEWAAQVPPTMGLVVRLDGKGFSKWTRPFASPFDVRINTAFIAVTSAMMEEWRPDVGFTQSDEITLMWYPNDPESTTEYPFGGKVQKLCSVLASHCTVLFNAEFDGHHTPALFDARAFGALTRGDCDAAVAWRAADAVRNGINSVAMSMFSARQLDGVSTRKRVEMLEAEGVDLDADYLPHNRHGTFMQFETVTEMLSAERLAAIPEKYRPTEPVEHRRLTIVD